MRALIDDREEGSRKEEAPEIRPEEERIPEEAGKKIWKRIGMIWKSVWRRV